MHTRKIWSGCIVFFFCFTTAAQNLPVNDSLYKIYSNTGLHDTVRLNAIHEISWSYVFSNPDTAFALALKELNLAKSKKQEYWIGKAYNNCGVSFHIKGDYPNALRYYKQSLAVREKINDKKGVAATNSNIGSIYFQQSDYVKALEHYYKSLKIEQQIGNKIGEAQTYNDLGLVFEELADNDKEKKSYEKALTYYRKSYEILMQHEDKYVLAATLGNMGNVHVEMGEFKKAHEYQLQCLELRTEIGDSQGKAACLGNIANIFHDAPDSVFMEYFGFPASEKFDRMLKNYEECYAIMTEIGDLNGKAISLSNLSGVYVKRKDFNKALKYALEALDIAYEVNAMELKKDNHGKAYDAYRAMGNFPEALKHFELFSAYKDSMLREENRKDVARKEIQFEYEKKAFADSVKHAEEKAVIDAKLDANKAELRARDAKLKQEETLKYALIIGIVLVVLFAVFLYNRFMLIKKQKTIIEDQKEIVEEKNREILDSISYAKRLQEAILPPEKLWKSVFPDSFIFYKPKDIIAGDFYFLEKTGGKIVFAVADCTGHGVPGAMVSVVCANALNRAVKEFKLTDSGFILDKVRELVLETFEKSENQVNDGMDIALCVLDPLTLQLQYSGANNPLWVIEGKSHAAEGKRLKSNDSNSLLPLALVAHGLKEYKADKQPIGKIFDPEPFHSHTIQLKKGDSLFLFTDGFADQFGGPKGKKFKYSNLQKFLLDNTGSPVFENMSTKLETVFSQWKGELDQVDDVSVTGIRL